MLPVMRGREALSAGQDCRVVILNPWGSFETSSGCVTGETRYVSICVWLLNAGDIMVFCQHLTDG